jgi:fluoride exporter
MTPAGACVQRQERSPPAERRAAERNGGKMRAYLIVFLGAGAGGMLRHGVNAAFLRLAGPGLPYGTLAVNILGSFAMGLIAGYLAFRGDASQPWRLFLTTGLLGGFTTFSAFSLDAALLWERGALWPFAAYVAGSVAASILALFAGLAIFRPAHHFL